jgi:hypothetical protein
MTDPFEFLDFTLEEAIKADSLVTTKRERDGRICNCGHPAGRHHEEFGVVVCNPSRMPCLCKKIKPVLEASDVRPFLRKTTGSGALHALGRGLQAAVTQGIKVEWLIEMKCQRCQAEGPISPASVTQNGIISNEPTGFDAMLCQDCRKGGPQVVQD